MKTTRTAKKSATISDDAACLLRYMSMRDADGDKVFAKDAIACLGFTNRQHTVAAEELERLGLIEWLSGVSLPGGFVITIEGRRFHAASSFAA